MRQFPILLEGYRYIMAWSGRIPPVIVAAIPYFVLVYRYLVTYIISFLIIL